MPSDSQNLSSQVVDSNQSLSDALLAGNLITKQQYDDIKVKTASQSLSEESVIEALNIVTPEKLAEV